MGRFLRMTGRCGRWRRYNTMPEEICGPFELIKVHGINTQTQSLAKKQDKQVVPCNGEQGQPSLACHLTADREWSPISGTGT